MKQLIMDIESLGYHFSEGNPVMSVKTAQEFMEIRELRVQSSDGQVLLIKVDNSPFLFPGGIAFRKGIMDRSLTDGIHTTCSEIYREYYGLDEDGLCMLLYNCSKRSRDYLDAEKTRIGLTDIKEGDPEPFFALDHYDVGMGIGQIDVGRYADGRFVAQTAHTWLYEDSSVLRMHFTRMPSREDLEDALIIRKMERDFKLGRHREVFTCNDCGETRHWLDIPGGIREKLSLRKQRKCGCAV